MGFRELPSHVLTFFADTGWYAQPLMLLVLMLLVLVLLVLVLLVLVFLVLVLLVPMV